MTKRYSEDEDSVLDEKEWQGKLFRQDAQAQTINDGHQDATNNDKSNNKEQIRVSSSIQADATEIPTTDEPMVKKEDVGEKDRMLIKEIKSHKYRYRKMKFLAMWEGCEDLGYRWVSEEEILEHSKDKLAKYLKSLHEKSPRSFNALIRQRKHLLGIIKKQ